MDPELKKIVEAENERNRAAGGGTVRCVFRNEKQ